MAEVRFESKQPRPESGLLITSQHVLAMAKFVLQNTPHPQRNIASSLEGLKTEIGNLVANEVVFTFHSHLVEDRGTAGTWLPRRRLSSSHSESLTLSLSTLFLLSL